MHRNNRIKLIFFSILINCTANISLANEVRPTKPIIKRLATSSSYGFGTISHGEVAKWIDGRAALFSYGINFSGSIINACTSRELYIGQKIFFSISSNVTINKNCPSQSHYFPDGYFSDFIYPGFNDLIAGDVFYEIPAGMMEDFDCPSVVVFSISSRIEGKKKNSLSNGLMAILGSRKYFSGKSLAECMGNLSVPLNKKAALGYTNPSTQPLIRIFPTQPHDTI